MVTPTTNALHQSRRRSKIVSIVLVLLALVSGMAATLADEVHNGKIVSAGEGKLQILDSDGENESFAVTAETKITLDGKPAQLSDLQNGYPVKVKAVRDGNMLSATSIEASTSE